MRLVCLPYPRPLRRPGVSNGGAGREERQRGGAVVGADPDPANPKGERPEAAVERGGAGRSVGSPHVDDMALTVLHAVEAGGELVVVALPEGCR